VWQSSITNLGSNGVVWAIEKNDDYLIFIVVSDEVNINFFNELLQQSFLCIMETFSKIWNEINEYEAIKNI
jgi:hypothetical protein